MIEFKAECGHTVRARDEDAGGLVRCSYCGKPANVPEAKNEGLDHLFDEAEIVSAQDGSAPTKKKKRRQRPALGVPRSRSGFNPFPFILKLCYFALLLCIVIIVSRKFILPAFQSAPTSTAGANPSDKPADAPSIRRKKDDAPELISSEKGLRNRALLAGFYVTSTPPGATVLYVPSAEAVPHGRINKCKNCQTLRPSSGGPPRLSDGTYVVELVLPWNDPNLKRFKGYTEFRRQVERASEAQRRQLVEDFFIPDEAVAVFFDETEEQKYIVRQYRNIEIRDGRSQGVRGLFLPRIAVVDGSGFSIEELVTSYIPDTEAYKFDEHDTKDELSFYGVSGTDQPWVLKALSRIGIMPYITQAKRELVFKVGIEDGVLSVKVLREPGK